MSGYHKNYPKHGVDRLKEAAAIPSRQPTVDSAPLDIEHVDAMFDYSLDMIVVVGFNGFFKKVNTSFTDKLGWDKAELRSRPFIEFVHPDDRDATMREFSKLQHGFPVIGFENRWMMKGGQGYVWLSWKAQGHADARLIYATAHDVTTLRENTTLDSKVEYLGSQIQSLKSTNIEALLNQQSSNVKKLIKEALEEDEEKVDDSPAGILKASWRVAAWVFGTLATLVTAIFGAGIAFQNIIHDNATKDDIKSHVETDLEPVKENIKNIEEDLKPVKKGIESLLHSEAKEKELKKAKARLDRFDKEYQEALQEYTADKAAGRRATRPRKTKDHLDLEVMVAEMEDDL